MKPLASAMRYGPGLAGYLEELGVGCPGHVAIRIGGRAGDDLRAVGPGGRIEGDRRGNRDAGESEETQAGLEFHLDFPPMEAVVSFAAVS